MDDDDIWAEPEWYCPKCDCIQPNYLIRWDEGRPLCPECDTELETD